jgi:hypothetical protein
MKRNMIFLGALLLVIAAPTQADFVQCTGGPCVADGQTDNADIINGTPDSDFIIGLGGNDVILGGAGNDFIGGEDAGVVDLNQGNDVIFGGTGSDVLEGHEGNDIIFPGPDDGEFSQDVRGDDGDSVDGNDITNVFAGDITTCLFIDSDGGSGDIVNLIGFGPYSLQRPFGQPGFAEGVIYLIDPIGGGEIFIEVTPDDDGDTEIINGLPTPNVTILPDDNPEEEDCPELPGF